MRSGEIEVVNQLGLHARAAAQLVGVAGEFESTIMLFKSDGCVSANAKSILSVLTLAASIGSVLTLEVEGADEVDAYKAIGQLFADGFGELE